MWYSGPWPVFPAFPGVREVIIFLLKIYGKGKYFQKKIMGRKKIPPGRRDFSSKPTWQMFYSLILGKLRKRNVSIE